MHSSGRPESARALRSSLRALEALRPSLWLSVGALVGVIVSFAFYASAERALERVHEARLRSFQLADELRHSSDDLTRMVRTYVVTGDPRYKQQYQYILDVRDGRRPRPEGYGDVSWDLTLEANPSGPEGIAVSLVDLMRAAGFTADELNELTRAKAESDALARVESTAMRLVEAAAGDADANRQAAIASVFDRTYDDWKVAIMEPIRDFNRMVDERTGRAVDAAVARARLMGVTFVISGAVLLWTLLRLRGALYIRRRVAAAEAQELRALAVAKDEAERANRVRNAFLATISHELRTPLHAVNGFSRLLQDAEGLDDEQKVHVRTIGEAGARLLGIVDDILEMAEIESGRVSSRLELFEPARLLDQVRSHLSQRATERKVGLVLDIEKTFPMLIEADLTNLGRALERLLANAIARSPAGGQVRLWMRSGSHDDGIQVNVLISDEGPCIDPSEHETIFEPFRSFDASEPSPQGAGLGLPISRRLARLARGDISVSSVPDGATFRLSFPARSPTGPPRVRERREDGRPSEVVFQEGVRRLIADLPEKLRGSLEGALRQGDVDGFRELLSDVPGEHPAELRWLTGQAELFQVEALLGMFPHGRATTA